MQGETSRLAKNLLLRVLYPVLCIEIPCIFDHCKRQAHTMCQSLFVYIKKTNNIEMPTHQKTPQCAIYLQRYVVLRLDNVLASNTVYYYKLHYCHKRSLICT